MKPSVLVLHGGTSSERAVSLRSGAAVISALKAAGFEVAEHDYEGMLPAQITQAVVFPVLHGAGGEDGAVQAQLDRAGACYVGSGVASSELCFNKQVYREFLKEHGLPVADGGLVTAESFAQSALANAPYVLKPFDGGSSVDTIIARDPRTISEATLANCFNHHPQMLLETMVDGVELTVGVLGGETLPVIEIIPPVNGEFDYENKYNGQTIELCPPRHIPQKAQEEARALALEIHNLCGCADFSRTDMIYGPDGSLTVLETNTIPGMTDQSLMPKAAAAAGYSFESLVENLVLMAWRRGRTG